MNKAQFYKTVRARMGPLNDAQVSGFETLLAVIAGSPMAYAAYMLATAWHETGETMLPIRERGGPTYFERMYDIKGDRPKLAADHGNTMPGDGARYYGRGYVQLTWKVNYARAGQKVGVDLVGNPDLAMRPDLAAAIMLDGMMEGWFTGKKMSTYLPAKGTATREEYVNARRIINGTDKAELVEDYAQVFERALRDAAFVA